MELPCGSYTWKLDTTDAFTFKGSVGRYFKSPIVKMLGFKWYLMWYPNYKSEDRTQFFLSIGKLPGGVASVTVNYHLSLEETDTGFAEENKLFDHNHSSWGWYKKTLMSKEIANMKTFTFKVHIQLQAVHDNDKNDISDQYTVGANDEQKAQGTPAVSDGKMRALELRVNRMAGDIETIKASLQQIQLQISEEEKVDADNVSLQQQIDELTVSVHKLLSGNAKEDDSEKGAFKNWVQNVLKLPEYLDVFVENGVETLNVAAMLTVSDIVDMGITKIGHKKLIGSAIEKLKQKANQSFAHAQQAPALMEGGPTAYL